MRLALSKWIKRRGVVDGVMSCWAMTAGRIHTAAGDQSRGWVAPPMVEEADSGSWLPDPAAPPQDQRPTARRGRSRNMHQKNNYVAYSYFGINWRASLGETSSQPQAVAEMAKMAERPL